MKKIISLLTASILCGSAMAMNVNAAESDISKYDLNLDGVINRYDVFSLNVYNRGQAYDNFDITDEVRANIAANGDFNGDGNVDNYEEYYYQLFDEGVFSADINLDGKISYSDTVVILEYFADLQTGRVPALDSEMLDSLLKNTEILITDPDRDIDALCASYLLNYFRDYYTDGDVNLDGTLNALDASSILDCYAKDQSGAFGTDNDLFNEYGDSRILGDYNGDGSVDALDASEVLALYAKAQAEAAN